MLKLTLLEKNIVFCHDRVGLTMIILTFSMLF